MVTGKKEAHCKHFLIPPHSVQVTKKEKKVTKIWYPI